jgi:predicted ester cyclase
VDTKRPIEPKTVVERYLAEVLNGARPEAAGELISDESLTQRVARFRKAFPDVAVTTDLLLAEGDLVAGHFRGRGTHEGLFNGVPATGREWDARCTAIYRVEDGRIVEAWVSWDMLSLIEQLGGIERARTVSA